MSRRGAAAGTAAVALPDRLEAARFAFLEAARSDRSLSPNTVAAYGRDLQRYLQGLARQGIESADQVRPEHVEQLLADLRSAGLSAATVARNLTSVRRFHAHLVAQGLTPADPSSELEPPRLERRLPDYLTADEIERLLAAPDPDEPLGRRDRALLELLYASGIRVSELIALELPCLRFGSGLLQVSGTPRHERLLPVGPQAIAAVETYLRLGRPYLAHPASGEVVFLNAQGHRLSRMGVWKIIKAAADRAAIGKRISPNTLRHSFAAHLLQGGATLRDVQELLGHADLSTTMVYAHLDSRYLVEVHRTYHPRG